MGAPQVVLIVYLAVCFGVSASHARTREAWGEVGYGLIGAGALCGILWWGGFWR